MTRLVVTRTRARRVKEARVGVGSIVMGEDRRRVTDRGTVLVGWCADTAGTEASWRQREPWLLRTSGAAVVQQAGGMHRGTKDPITKNRARKGKNSRVAVPERPPPQPPPQPPRYPQVRMHRGMLLVLVLLLGWTRRFLLNSKPLLYPLLQE